ncbi:MAG: putative permease [Rickettsiaceae bacterium]|jgi:lipopolysaccharide export system permease protein|nr:putative permease [Rickettsiaceae bacterium]
MLIYQKHIFKHLLSLFALTCFVCTGIVWLSQSLKLVYLVTKGLPVSTFFALTLLTLPSLLLTIIPISLFLSTIYYYNKIKHDREMVVMENSGLNYLQIAKPAIYLSIILTLTCYIISLYLLPLSYGKLKSKLNSLKEGYSTSLLHAKTFNPISKNVTLYFDKKFYSGALGGLVIFDFREHDQPAIIFAKLGKLIVKSDSLTFRLAEGSRQHTNLDGQIDLLNFKDLLINIQTRQSDKKRTSTDIQEKYLYELFSPKDEGNMFRISKFRAEGHQRLARPLFNIMLIMVGLACIIPEVYNRRSTTKPIIKAVAIAVAIVILNFVLSNLSINNHWLDYFVYLNLMMAVVISYYKLSEKNEL